MKLSTQISLPKNKNGLSYNSFILLLGSCFAENLGFKLEELKFSIVQNPFGILYHPLAIQRLIERSVYKQWFCEDELIYNNERWHSYDAHSNLSSSSKKKLLNRLNTCLKTNYRHIKGATHILITFGTSWVYSSTKSNKIVANCHKVENNLFEKRLLSVEEIQDSIIQIVETIRSINSSTTIIFTISPVRHLKDGFVENQRSKSHLITALHSVIEYSKYEGLLYFPAYEILMDELRDYRFYSEDLVHPSNISIDYIWEKFIHSWIDDSALPIMKKIQDINKGLAHRPFDKTSNQYVDFLRQLEIKIKALEINRKNELLKELELKIDGDIR